ncbi:MAG: HlyD family type I secretion periplasmic adaptor subunit [Myxococcota bacterium]
MNAENSDRIEVSTDTKPYVKGGLLGLLGLAAAFIGWATLAELDGAVIAPGKVAVEGSRKTVQATGSGVVSELLVRDGEHVTEGQVLVRIDHTVSRAVHENARARFEALLAAQSRLDAERSDATTITFGEELSSGEPSAQRAIETEEARFHARREERRAAHRAIEARIPRLEATRGGHRARWEAARIEASAVQEDLESARALFDRGYLSKTRLRALERDHARARGQAASSLAEANSTAQEIEEARLELAHAESQWRERVTSELETTRRALLDARRALVEAERGLHYTAVRAPTTGHVFGLAVHTEGGVVREGQELLQIVPDEAPLIVEARIPVHEVDRISQGQSARVQLTAFDVETVAPVEGTVESISADRVEDPALRTGFYVARIRIEHAVANLSSVELRAGMPAETWIRTGQKSAVRYLMEPLTSSWERAFTDG